MGKIITIGEGTYKGIADKSIDAGKFTDGAFKELVDSVLPEKVDETINNKIEEKSQEIDSTLQKLREDLDAETDANIDAFTKVKAQLDELELISVTSDEVDRIRVVSKKKYEELKSKDELDERTLYHILE
jgi:hypothetical protein